jgi:hypothetical protein
VAGDGLRSGAGESAALLTEVKEVMAMVIMYDHFIVKYYYICSYIYTIYVVLICSRTPRLSHIPAISSYRFFLQVAAGP